MRHEAAIVLSFATLISILACALPYWSHANLFGQKMDIGLWESCADAPVVGRQCGKHEDNPGDLVTCQIFSIVGILAFATAVVLCLMKKKGVRIAGIVGIVSLLLTVIVYGASVQSNKPGDLSASFYIEIAAIIIGIWGVIIKPGK